MNGTKIVGIMKLLKSRYSYHLQLDSYMCYELSVSVFTLLKKKLLRSKQISSIISLVGNRYLFLVFCFYFFLLIITSVFRDSFHKVYLILSFFLKFQMYLLIWSYGEAFASFCIVNALL